MDEVTTRPAKVEDAPAVQGVARESWHATYDDLLAPETIEHALEAWYDVEALAESIARPESIFRVATDADVMGFAQAGPHPDADAERDGDENREVFKLSRIYLRPDRWGEGIGTMLLDDLAEDVRAAGGTAVRLTVHADNDVGIDFYESRGFERIGKRETTLAEETHPEYAYQKSL